MTLLLTNCAVFQAEGGRVYIAEPTRSDRKHCCCKCGELIECGFDLYGTLDKGLEVIATVGPPFPDRYCSVACLEAI